MSIIFQQIGTDNILLDHHLFYFNNLANIFNLLFLTIIGDSLTNLKLLKIQFQKATINFAAVFFTSQSCPLSNFAQLLEIDFTLIMSGNWMDYFFLPNILNVLNCFNGKFQVELRNNNDALLSIFK
jgi:hypothetical protein